MNFDSKRLALLFAALVSLVWNLYLVVSATFNSTSILPRVAGGQFDSIPVFLRVMFGIQSLLIIYQLYFVVRLYQRGGAWSKNSYLLTRVFLVLTGVSAIMNFVSRSSQERWNTIPAVLIALAYYLLGNVRYRPTK